MHIIMHFIFKYKKKERFYILHFTVRTVCTALFRVDADKKYSKLTVIFTFKLNELHLFMSQLERVQRERLLLMKMLFYG